MNADRTIIYFKTCDDVIIPVVRNVFNGATKVVKMLEEWEANGCKTKSIPLQYIDAQTLNIVVDWIRDRKCDELLSGEVSKSYVGSNAAEKQEYIDEVFDMYSCNVVKAAFDLGLEDLEFIARQFAMSHIEKVNKECNWQLYLLQNVANPNFDWNENRKACISSSSEQDSQSDGATSMEQFINLSDSTESDLSAIKPLSPATYLEILREMDRNKISMKMLDLDLKDSKQSESLKNAQETATYDVTILSPDNVACSIKSSNTQPIQKDDVGVQTDFNKNANSDKLMKPFITSYYLKAMKSLGPVNEKEHHSGTLETDPMKHSSGSTENKAVDHADSEQKFAPKHDDNSAGKLRAMDSHSGVVAPRLTIDSRAQDNKNDSEKSTRKSRNNTDDDVIDSGARPYGQLNDSLKLYSKYLRSCSKSTSSRANVESTKKDLRKVDMPTTQKFDKEVQCTSNRTDKQHYSLVEGLKARIKSMAEQSSKSGYTCSTESNIFVCKPKGTLYQKQLEKPIENLIKAKVIEAQQLKVPEKALGSSVAAIENIELTTGTENSTIMSKLLKNCNRQEVTVFELPSDNNVFDYNSSNESQLSTNADGNSNGRPKSKIIVFPEYNTDELRTHSRNIVHSLKKKILALAEHYSENTERESVHTSKAVELSTQHEGLKRNNTIFINSLDLDEEDLNDVEIELVHTPSCSTSNNEEIDKQIESDESVFESSFYLSSMQTLSEDTFDSLSLESLIRDKKHEVIGQRVNNLIQYKEPERTSEIKKSADEKPLTVLYAQMRAPNFSASESQYSEYSDVDSEANRKLVRRKNNDKVDHMKEVLTAKERSRTMQTDGISLERLKRKNLKLKDLKMSEKSTKDVDYTINYKRSSSETETIDEVIGNIKIVEMTDAKVGHKTVSENKATSHQRTQDFKKRTVCKKPENLKEKYVEKKDFKLNTKNEHKTENKIGTYSVLARNTRNNEQNIVGSGKPSSKILAYEDEWLAYPKLDLKGKHFSSQYERKNAAAQYSNTQQYLKGQQNQCEHEDMPCCSKTLFKNRSEECEDNIVNVKQPKLRADKSEKPICSGLEWNSRKKKKRNLTAIRECETPQPTKQSFFKSFKLKQKEKYMQHSKESECTKEEQVIKDKRKKYEKVTNGEKYDRLQTEEDINLAEHRRDYETACGAKYQESFAAGQKQVHPVKNKLSAQVPFDNIVTLQESLKKGNICQRDIQIPKEQRVSTVKMIKKAIKKCATSYEKCQKLPEDSHDNKQWSSVVNSQYQLLREAIIDGTNRMHTNAVNSSYAEAVLQDLKKETEMVGSENTLFVPSNVESKREKVEKDTSHSGNSALVANVSNPDSTGSFHVISEKLRKKYAVFRNASAVKPASGSTAAYSTTKSVTQDVSEQSHKSGQHASIKCDQADLSKFANKVVQTKESSFFSESEKDSYAGKQSQRTKHQ